MMIVDDEDGDENNDNDEHAHDAGAPAGLASAGWHFQ